jgi:inorganic pyrophosphatase
MEEMEKLKTILQHWIRHNESHFEEYKKWAEIASSAGLGNVSESILKAMELIKLANEEFQKALNYIP